MSKTSQWALITGASFGIGEVFSYELAKKGYNLILTARSYDKLNELSMILQKEYGISVKTIALDLGLQDSADKIFEFVSTESIDISLLINNAGFGLYSTVVDMDINVSIEMMNLNMVSLTKLTQLFLPSLLKNKNNTLKSGIIFVSSSAGLQPIPYFAVYAATKAYVISFAESLSEELRGSGLNVQVLCPGPTKTQFNLRASLGNLKKVPFQDTPESVVRKSLNAFYKGRPVVYIPGFLIYLWANINRFLTRKQISGINRIAFSLLQKVRENYSPK